MENLAPWLLKNSVRDNWEELTLQRKARL